MSPDERASAYARAFHEAVWQRWLGVLEGVARQLQDQPGLRERVRSDDAELAQRAIDTLLPPETDAPVRNLLYTLAQRNDLDTLPDVTQALRERVERITGPVEIEVISAVPLTDAERTALEPRMQAQFGKDAAFHYLVDPTILGGMIIRAGDKLIDGSVASRLAALRQTLGLAGERQHA